MFRRTALFIDNVTVLLFNFVRIEFVFDVRSIIGLLVVGGITLRKMSRVYINISVCLNSGAIFILMRLSSVVGF